MYHIFCIHSSVEGHLCSFQLLAIINKAAMNIVDHVSLLHVGAPSVYIPRSGIAAFSSSTMSNFLRNWFPEWLYKVAIPPTMEECSSFSISSQASSATWDFNFSHSDWCEVKSHGCFDLHFLDDWECGTFIFKCFSAIQYPSFEHSLFSSVPHF